MNPTQGDRAGRTTDSGGLPSPEHIALIAVVSSEPSTHRTSQLKARQVTTRPARPEEQALLQRYLHAMETQLAQVGIRAEQARAMPGHQLADVVAVGFMPEEACDQTPGPCAGVSKYCLALS